MRTIIAIATAATLAGCASVNSPMDDGYQFGDLTGTVLSLQAEYCSSADPRERAFRLAALRAAGVPVPRSGACADILALVPEVDIDTSETEADRRRFEEMRDAGVDSEATQDGQGSE